MGIAALKRAVKDKCLSALFPDVQVHPDERGVLLDILSYGANEANILAIEGFAALDSGNPDLAQKKALGLSVIAGRLSTGWSKEDAMRTFIVALHINEAAIAFRGAKKKKGASRMASLARSVTRARIMSSMINGR